jgi:hypothetical protein
MSTFMLVLLMLNPQGHTVYKAAGKFPTLAACNIKAGQLALHDSVKGTMCVEQYTGYVASDNHANK